MITATQLESVGYRKYPNRLKQYARGMYQKRFDDTEGQKYFINFYEYDNRKDGRHLHPIMNIFSYSSSAQFNDRHGNTFNVECLTNDSIESVEAFFERVWRQLDCEYYELFDGGE